MTFILTVNSRESIWLLADRRLSSPKDFDDTGRKLISLETTDGEALLGYSGLGATALGTEPSDWMGAVLRGRNFTLEQSLSILAEALTNQFPKHLAQLDDRYSKSHQIVATAFIGNELRLYTIDLATVANHEGFQCLWRRHLTPTPTRHPPPLTVGGSGAVFLNGKKDLLRLLLHIIKAYENKRISPHVVADHLSQLNIKVSQGTKDNSVSPGCIVAWKNRKEGIHKGGGGFQFYNNGNRVDGDKSYPAIARGHDVVSIADVLAPLFLKMFESKRRGEIPKDVDNDEINKILANLPQNPDEDLR